MADDSTSVSEVSSEVWTIPNNEVHTQDNQGQPPTEVHVVVSVQPEEKKPQRTAYQERRSGRIPTRKRSVPFKFRDYRNPDLVNEENEGEEAEEEKFTPEEEFRNVSLVKRPATSSTRKRGRPRKLPQYEVPMTQEVITLDANTANSLRAGALWLCEVQSDPEYTSTADHYRPVHKPASTAPCGTNLNPDSTNLNNDSTGG